MNFINKHYWRHILQLYNDMVPKFCDITMPYVDIQISISIIFGEQICQTCSHWHPGRLFFVVARLSLKILNFSKHIFYGQGCWLAREQSYDCQCQSSTFGWYRRYSSVSNGTKQKLSGQGKQISHDAPSRYPCRRWRCFDTVATDFITILLTKCTCIPI